MVNVTDFYEIEPLKYNHEGNTIIQPPLSNRDIPRVKIKFKPIPPEYEPPGELGMKTGHLNQSEIEYKKWLQIELLIATHRPHGYPIDSLTNDCEAIANRLVRAREGELNLLVTQNILSEEDQILLKKRSKDFNVAALSFRISQMLQEYLETNLTKRQINILIRKLFPLIRFNSLIKEFDMSVYDTVIAIKKYKDPRKWLSQAVSLAKKLAQEFKVPLHLAMFAIKGYRNPRKWLRKAVPLAKKLAQEFNISFHDAMLAVREYKKPKEYLEKKLRDS